MAEVKQVRHRADSDLVVDRAKDFWTRNSRAIYIAVGAIVLLVGGWLVYKYAIKAPKEAKANEAIWRAQQNFELDSLQKALKGDGQAPGFEKIASQYSGTAAGNLAKFYAGVSAERLEQHDAAVKYLKDFSTDAKQIQARAYKVLADAYAALGKTSEALENYKKAGREFEKDEAQSSEFLFLAAYYADRVVNNKTEATNLYKELRSKYPSSQYGREAQKFLGQQGVYTED